MDDLTLANRLRTVVGSSVPGVVVAIVDAEGIRARAALGAADLATGTAASTQMLCPWFSMTKVVTVTAAMRLAEAGLFDLDEPVLKHVPAIGRLNPARDSARITPRHLMSHSGGIASPIPTSLIHRPDEAGPVLDDLVERLLRTHSRLRFEPGTRAGYTNLGMLVLGLAIQRVAARDFAQVIRQEVLEPLGMRLTGFSFPSESVRATGYHRRSSPLPFMVPQWVLGDAIGEWFTMRPFLVDGPPYGGLVGPLEDAARFLQMHLRDGELHGVRLLPSSVTLAMREINKSGTRFDLGLGWFRPSTARNADPAFVEHLGGAAGFWNVMRIYPSRRVGVAVMGNATNCDVDTIAALALD
jgi:CubicO group peptidase (beta-lactamase class C family)